MQHIVKGWDESAFDLALSQSRFHRESTARLNECSRDSVRHLGSRELACEPFPHDRVAIPIGDERHMLRRQVIL